MNIENGPEDEIEDDVEVENDEGDEIETPEPELPVAVQIVQAALQGDAIGVKDIFKAAVTDRITDIVADRKQAIANSLITPDQPEEQLEPEENEYEEDQNDNSVGDSDSDTVE